MPELPEVETTIRGLKPIKGFVILNIKIHTPKLRFLIPKNISLMDPNIIIKDIQRRGKFILIYLNNNHCIVIHLGMSGRLRLYKKNFDRKKHDHFVIETSNSYFLVLNDARRFGFIDFDTIGKIYEKKYLLNLGIDALDKRLSGKYLLSKISNTMVPIKQILLDQKIIAGIGNIYASEILFMSEISPFEIGKNLKLTHCEELVVSIKKILNKAIKAGGSTLRDYVSADGTLGNFQNKFKVYNKQGEIINGKKIIKEVQYGRSTYYCPEIQTKINSKN